ncbi:MAG: acetyl-CoA C-acetyltransferase [Deltaproteobacteria bacterium]|nr:acetyl-CoA C-acetyltransferase [Candidatus Anaeroferrophillacea bacterium]
MDEVVIVSAVRTPIGNFLGSLRSFTATELGAMVITAAIERAGIGKEAVDEVIMGNVVPIGLGQNPGRQAMIRAGLPMAGGAITVNKVCGSGLKAVMLAEQAIKCGDAEVIVAGGMESMSNVPHYLENSRNGTRMGNVGLVDGMVHDGLWDVVNDFHMGYTAELVSAKFDVTREDMDRFSIDSNAKALAAHEAGSFKREILPLTVIPRRGDPYQVTADEGPRATTLEALAKLRPAFKKDGLVTAGNASKISDGASAVVVMSRRKAEELGCTPMARIVAQGSAGVVLEDVLVAPMQSIPKVLKKAGMELGQIDLHEINEAFAASTAAVIKVLGIDMERVNIHGGAVALGHPIGCSGARVLTTLLYALQDRGKRFGMASLCLGGGEAVTMIVENLG